MAGLTWTGVFNANPLLSAFSNAQTQISNRMKAISNAIAGPETRMERWAAVTKRLPTLLISMMIYMSLIQPWFPIWQESFLLTVGE